MHPIPPVPLPRKPWPAGTLVVLAALLATGLRAEPASACATCLCGDPTLTTMGTEKPFAGRLRFTVDYLSRGEKFGEPGINRQTVHERRVTYSVSYALNERWMFSASQPVVTKKVERFDLSSERAGGLGDLDLSARWFIGTDDHFPARALWGAQFGLRLPTSTEQKSGGQAIDFDAQPGAGATLYSLGAWYGHYAMPWLFYASGTYQRALTDGYQGYRSGDAVLVTAHSQYAPGYRVALQLAVDGRWRQEDRYDGVADPDSGGVLVMLTPGLAWMPFEDLVANISYQLPVIENPHGHQEEAPTLRVGMTYDL